MEGIRPGDRSQSQHVPGRRNFTDFHSHHGRSSEHAKGDHRSGGTGNGDVHYVIAVRAPCDRMCAKLRVYAVQQRLEIERILPKSSRVERHIF